jgi:predicted TPR repeat methyltransferase
MIHGFEQHTENLNDYEKQNLLPAVVRLLHFAVGEHKAVTNKQIICDLKANGFKISDTKVRKIVNHIRTHNIIRNLLASSKGYYRALSEADCRRFIQSLEQRMNSIAVVRDAMTFQLEQTKLKRNQLN